MPNFNNSQSDELNQFTKALDSKAGNPSDQFKANLRSRALNKYLGLNFISTHIWQSVAGVVLALSVVGVVVFVGINGNLNSGGLNSQSKEVLTKVFSNNPQNLLALKNQTPATDLQAAQAKAETATGGGGNTAQAFAPAVDLPVQYINAKAFNYSYSKSEIKSGPALSKCQAYSLGQEGVVETYSFFDDKTSKSKTITYDTDKNLIDYYLYAGDSAISYKGGKYAVNTKYSMIALPAKAVTQTAPAEPTVDSNSSLSQLDQAINSAISENAKSSVSSTTSSLSNEMIALNFFGDNAQVSDKQSGDGHEYYEITWTTQVNCNLPVATPVAVGGDVAVTNSDTSGNTAKVVNKVRVDATTYNVFQEERYLNQISAENLMQQSTNETQTQKTALADVQQNFTFEFSVPIKEVEVKASDSTVTEQLKSLSQQDFAVLVPTSENFKVNGFSNPAAAQAANSAQYSYLSDRDFYPTGERGDKLYQEAKTWQDKLNEAQNLTPEFNLMASDSKQSITINEAIFSGTTTEADLTKNFISNGTKKLDDLVTQIGGQKVTWTVYEFTASSVVTPEQSEPGSAGGGASGSAGAVAPADAKSPATNSGIVPPQVPDRITIKNTFLIGKFYKNIYVIQVTGDYTKLKLSSYITSDSSSFSKLSDLITKDLNSGTTVIEPQTGTGSSSSIPTLDLETKPKSK